MRSATRVSVLALAPTGMSGADEPASIRRSSLDEAKKASARDGRPVLPYSTLDT